MFESLSDRLSGILDKLTRRGSLTDSDVAEAMRAVFPQTFPEAVLL